jgi:NAD(P)-dependent dehydrogenase (short-subunit alcohol dehydrogenase family)
MQRVFVSGANRGIGLEFTRQLLGRGARVFAACRQPGKALKLTELAAAHPGRLHVLPLDLTKERSIAEVARETAALTDALDLLVNNAGVLVAGERYGELAAKTFLDTFAVNTVGTLLLTQALTPLLAKGDTPKIVNLTSDLGSLAKTTSFYTPSYAISKAGLNMATRLLAAELGNAGITVICANPGWVKTDMGGAQAPVTPLHSVCGLLTLIEGLQRRDSGRFFDYTGAAHDW